MDKTELEQALELLDEQNLGPGEAILAVKIGIESLKYIQNHVKEALSEKQALDIYLKTYTGECPVGCGTCFKKPIHQ
jgi:hypothetical protein